MISKNSNEFTAKFRFHDSLNDFLSGKQRNQEISYSFNNAPAIKDSIEAIGIPHTEVDSILVNDLAVDFYYHLQNNDWVDVFPLNQYQIDPNSKSLQSQLTQPIKFILDVHLGKLAKELRLLGFDTFYRNDYDDQTIVTVAKNEQRIILTRDIGLLKHKSIQWGYWLRSQQPEQQLKEVIARFNLASKINAFSRCLECNENIVVVDKEAVLHNLPPKTIEYFNEFYQCSSCKRVYWKGSHYENMLKLLQRINVNE